MKFLVFLSLIVNCITLCLAGQDCSLTLHVRDEHCQPVCNATAMVYVVSKLKFNAGADPSDWTRYQALTDTNGMAVVQFQCFYDGDYEWGAEADGYYCPNMKSSSFDGEGQDASTDHMALIEAEKAKIAAGTGGSWLQVIQLMNPSFTLHEHAATNVVTFVRKRNPQPMYKRDYTNSDWLEPLDSFELGNGIVSNTYPRVGFDLKEGEYLMPYGDGGEFADFWVEQHCIVSNDVKTYVGHIELAPGCGVYRAQKEDRDLGPVCFNVDTNMVFTNRLDFAFSIRGWETTGRTLASGNEYLVFHTRVTDNGNGQLTAGNYSLMEGLVEIAGGISFNNLIFNPRPGDTNLEMDPRKNYAASWREEWED